MLGVAAPAEKNAVTCVEDRAASAPDDLLADDMMALAAEVAAPAGDAAAVAQRGKSAPLGPRHLLRAILSPSERAGGSEVGVP